ncbi:hypothetical protein KSS87_002624 [Heliosperma pusillum]|nr:hypothetical protein KSS87_002624 [Heliosperma pusillum]
MVSFEDVCGGGKRSQRPFFYTYDQEENGDDDFEEYLHQPEKKRRLTIEQVEFLEKSFGTENKLEPERKDQLAKELGLQPRQVAIWFQNRRARWKNKQTEKDFDTLQASYNSLKSNYESLLKEKANLKAEVDHLTNKLQLKEQDHRTNSEESEPSNAIGKSTLESEDQQMLMFGYNKQEDPSSAKSDVIDSDSPHYLDAAHSSSFAEPGVTSYAFEADHSDISQDVFPKIEDVDLPADSNHFGLSGDDHASLFWPYWDIHL